MSNETTKKYYLDIEGLATFWNKLKEYIEPIKTYVNILNDKIITIEDKVENIEQNIGSSVEELLEEYKPGEILETAPNEILKMLFNGEITVDDLIETTGSEGVPVVDSKTNYIHFCDIFYKYFWFTALEDNCSIGFYHNPDSSIKPTLEYSFDKYEWNILSDNISIPKDTNMYVRGMNVNGISPGYNDGNYNYFVGEGKFNVSGDIMTLINHQSIPDKMVGTLYTLFGRESDDFVDIVDASNLILSAKTLTSDCYQRMFDSCSSMIYSPQIKAEVLAPYCCHTMFFGCTSLTTAPILPATELADNCYYAMFSGCTALTTAPELPATTLSTGCYESMFNSCTSLTTAPELPAITLTDNCYFYMFNGCTSLNYIKCLATDISARDCTTGWVYNVANIGTFVKHPDMTSWTRGLYGIPAGWTVENYTE